MERWISGAMVLSSCEYFILIIRGAYLAVVAATLTNVKVPIMFEKTAEWIASCQTYEGGFSAVPGECRSHDPYDDVIMIQELKHTAVIHFVDLPHWCC